MSLDPTELEYCRTAVSALAKTEGIDEYAHRALLAINQRLDAIARGDKSNAEKAKGLIARLVVEQDPALLYPQLGGRLIALERSFYA
ncbi:hypothetical protein [Acidovorax lacteus]|uniref:Uncharacterized protein n=1 Tax=Acidovorax lacteus TaxID=1924988 RepID=A0ABP8LLH1_9BURK